MLRWLLSHLGLRRWAHQEENVHHVIIELRLFFHLQIKTPKTCKVMLRLKEIVSIQDTRPAWARGRTQHLAFFLVISPYRKEKRCCSLKLAKLYFGYRNPHTSLVFWVFCFFFYPINPTVDSEDSRADGLLWWHRDSSCFSLVESPPLMVLPA